MWNSKSFLIVAGIVILGVTSAHAAEDFLRDANGNIRNMNQYEAMKACPTGTHLPTARELANYGHSLGTQKVAEPNEVDAEKYQSSDEFRDPEKGAVLLLSGKPLKYGYGWWDDYYLINPDRKKDEFYYDERGYKHPDGTPWCPYSYSDGTPECINVWSSSILVHEPSYSVVFESGSGRLYPLSRDESAPVICFPDR